MNDKTNISTDKDPPDLSEADIEHLRDENALLQDRFLRALADIENTRRRGERAAEDARQFAISGFALDLLEVNDSLQRAIDAVEPHLPDTGTAALVEGIKATQRMLVAVLERHGIRGIDAIGKPFDPNMHEAVMEVDDSAREPGIVVEVLEDGYTIHGRLLRPARVVTTKHTYQREARADAKEQKAG
jgi:molecular chaperone GrpE